MTKQQIEDRIFVLEDQLAEGLSMESILRITYLIKDLKKLLK